MAKLFSTFLWRKHINSIMSAIFKSGEKVSDVDYLGLINKNDIELINDQINNSPDSLVNQINELQARVSTLEQGKPTILYLKNTITFFENRTAFETFIDTYQVAVNQYTYYPNGTMFGMGWDGSIVGDGIIKAVNVPELDVCLKLPTTSSLPNFEQLQGVFMIAETTGRTLGATKTTSTGSAGFQYSIYAGHINPSGDVSIEKTVPVTTKVEPEIKMFKPKYQELLAVRWTTDIINNFPT